MKKVLILLPRQLGDVLLGTPIPQILKQRYPNIQVDWWAHPLAKPILDGNSYIDQAFYYPISPKNKAKKNVFAHIKHFFLLLKFAIDSVRFVLLLRKQKYDTLVDVINYPRSALQAFITGAKVKVSFKTKSVRDLVYTHLIPRENLDTGYLGHTRLKLLEPLGITLTQQDLLQVRNYLPILDANKIKPNNWVKENITAQNVRGFFVVSPTHRRAPRRWPGPYFVQLALQLIQKHNCVVVWLRAPGEDDQVLPIYLSLKAILMEQGIDSSRNILPPHFSLKEVGYLTTLSLGWVGNDNGMSHIAAACGSKTVGIYGPSPPLSWCHPNRAQCRFVQRQTGCVACSKPQCILPRRECLDDLKVETVLKEVEDLCLN